jgi:hypothetical protein
VLRDLQLELGRAFRERGAGGEEARGVLPALRPTARLSAAECLGIYQSAVENALLESLRDIFPVCAALVGEDCFRQIARCHGLARDARHADLARSGEGLPELMPELSFLDGVPYLADVARLELAWHEAFTAPAPPQAPDPARIADAVSHAPERWRFRLAPSAQLLHSVHPVLSIWEAHERAAECGGELELDLEEHRGDDFLIVWRRGSDLCLHWVEDSLWPLLQAIDEGCSVAELLSLGERAGGPDVDSLGESSPEDYEPILNAIGELFARGWIAGVEELVNADDSA